MTYFEFQNELKGYDFYQNDKPIYKYQMYWKRYLSHSILLGKYNITKTERVR